MRRQVCILATAVLVIAALESTASASGVSIDPVSWSYNIIVCDCEGGNSLSDASPTPLPASGNVSYPDSDESTVVSGSAGATVTMLPAILVTASLAQLSEFNLGAATARGEMTFYLEVTAQPGFGGTVPWVPVLFTGTASQGITGADVLDSSTTSVSMKVSTLDGSDTEADVPSDQNGAFSGSMKIIPGVEYEVDMSADAEVHATTGGASAAIDPMFTIDPDYANDFALTLSDGIQNDVATTPLPATLPLFATGLGGLGLFGYRRKKKARAA